MIRLALPIALALLTVTRAQSEIINFDLTGVAGNGMLPGNEPGAIVGGTGGEIGSGITYDTATSNLTIIVA